MNQSLLTRRDFTLSATTLAAAAAVATPMHAADETAPLPILDTHQHLWDIEKLTLPWLPKEPPLNKSHVTKDYLAAVEGLNVVRTVYMEVDVTPKQHVTEAEYVLALTKDAKNLTAGAVIGGRPAEAGFRDYVTKWKDQPRVHGVRQVLHGDSTPRGFCLAPEFIKGVRILGEFGKSFDLCMRPAELSDAVKLIDACPETKFILDHCGNGDPFAFMAKAPAGVKPNHTVDQYRRDIAELAKRDRVVCKISGIVARMAGHKWTADDLAPVINTCLDAFGPERVIFASDWPVCTLAASLKEWVTALKAIVASRPRDQQQKLLAGNAQRVYKTALAG